MWRVRPADHKAFRALGSGQIGFVRTTRSVSPTTGVAILKELTPALDQIERSICHQSPWACCDSSFCFIVTRTRSSEERVLSTATLRTMLPFNPVSPACFEPLTVMM